MNNNLAKRIWTPLARNRLAPLLEPVILNTVSGITSNYTFYASKVVASGNTIYLAGIFEMPTGANSTVSITGDGICYDTSVESASNENGVTTLVLSNPVASRGILVSDILELTAFTPATVPSPSGLQLSLCDVFAFSDSSFTVSLLATRYSRVALGYEPVGIDPTYIKTLMSIFNSQIEGYEFSEAAGATVTTQSSVVTMNVTANPGYELVFTDSVDADLSFVNSGIKKTGTTNIELTAGKVLQATPAMAGYKY